MWYDTVGHGHPPALRCAADSLGADRLVLGTDFPYQNAAAYERAVGYITTSGLASGDADRVLSANAEALFGPRAQGWNRPRSGSEATDLAPSPPRPHFREDGVSVVAKEQP
jgi:hypothetical protein